VPGPQTVDMGSRTRLVLLDTVWWLFLRDEDALDIVFENIIATAAATCSSGFPLLTIVWSTSTGFDSARSAACPRAARARIAAKWSVVLESSSISAVKVPINARFAL
jgi:hypothetical protein